MEDHDVGEAISGCGAGSRESSTLNGTHDVCWVVSDGLWAAHITHGTVRLLDEALFRAGE